MAQAKLSFESQPRSRGFGKQRARVAARALRSSGRVTSRAEPGPELVSVIIPNHNYARYLTSAIESALALDWPKVEVIVVDDGSSDGSRDVISSFRERVIALYQAQGGQAAACNTGFRASHGDAVIFLDADDVLAPSLIRKLAPVWRPSLSKVQVQMAIIDADGKPTGNVLPQYGARAPTPAEVRRWALEAASYPTPPGSGNVYARSFLSQLFPLRGEDRAADSYCIAAAPYLGDVVTLPEPLVYYRVHGANQGAMRELDTARFARELTRARARLAYARSVSGDAHGANTDEVLRRSLSSLPYRLASLKLRPADHPIARDDVWRVLRDMLEACTVPQGLSAQARATLVLWATAFALAPQPIARRLALWRFASSTRPKLLSRSLSFFRVVERHASSV